LTRRQVRWSEFLSEFDFRISYRPGKLNKKPDALTRRSQDLPENEADERLLHQNQILLKPELFVASSSSNPDTEVQLCPTSIQEAVEMETSTQKISRLLEEGYKTDQFWLRIMKEMTKASGIPHSKEISLSECNIDGGRLFFRDRLYVPDNDLRILLLQSAHDSCESGHPGKNKLFEVLSRDWWWPNISQACSSFGALKPLPLPIQRWREISVDFIGPLPSSDGFNCIMVVVDRLSKERHYSACLTTMNAQDLARIFIRDIYRLHGLPDFIVSDRGAVFVAEFWKAACHCLQINVSYSTAYHPETDGQTENANAFLEQYLRHYINFAQNDWNEWLPIAEFAANNAVNASTSMSPFFANKGFHPRLSFGPPRKAPRNTSNHLRVQNNKGNEFVHKMEDVLKELRSNLITARANQEESASNNRMPAPAYRVGDKVFLSTRNIDSARPCKKLDSKFIGECKVVEVVNPHSYRIELPFENGLIHDVFHTSLLLPSANNPLPGQVNKPP
ncbi:hypothetical protein K3495_g15367, partial [Podosphaera aphanis]